MGTADAQKHSDVSHALCSSTVVHPQNVANSKEHGGHANVVSLASVSAWGPLWRGDRFWSDVAMKLAGATGLQDC